MFQCWDLDVVCPYLSKFLASRLAAIVVKSVVRQWFRHHHICNDIACGRVGAELCYSEKVDECETSTWMLKRWTRRIWHCSTREDKPRKTTIGAYSHLESMQGCQLGFFEAKFVIFCLFSTPLVFRYFWKKAKWNLAFFGLFLPHRFFMSIWEI